MISTIKGSIIAKLACCQFCHLDGRENSFYLGRDKRIACMILNHFLEVPALVQSVFTFVLDIVLWTMVKVVFLLNQKAPQQSALLIFL